ncbi:DUF488 domain-containing protein [Thermopolyspora flexuosa]|uniref:Uncharacterized protein DUF488 n=1 Tax=Thermopolyspora flexuosa TaxID=103836 RepID=A0A543J472_9ACTN|nr:DUF488 domain-containing protein [Thermopolyspora flexuosa]TQM77629.1 uncharacterized protein DUF488 [Thermopolyspora flexuosa]
MASRQHCRIVGIGYQGSDLDTFINRMLGDGLRTLVDVRLTPISRKPGFSKRRLADALAANGIDYIHLAVLGNPKWNRPGFAGSQAELAQALAVYRELINHPDAFAAIDLIAEKALTGLTGVLCFEADEHRCHRQVVLERVLDRLAASGRNGDLCPAGIEDPKHAEDVPPLGLVTHVESGVTVGTAHVLQPTLA